jgi:hypothetical protein
MDEAEPDEGEPKRPGVSLLDLRLGQCGFNVDERVHPVRFCGEPTVGGGSWCALHRRVVYEPSAKRKPPQQDGSGRPHPPINVD